MRILLLNDYGTPTAGAERLTQWLRDGLRDRGHEVRVLTSRAELIPGESFADATCFGTTSRLQTFTSTINLSATRALRRELATFPPDVVQAHMFLWQLSPSILSLLHDVPSVYYAMTYKAVCPTGLKWLPNGTVCGVRAGAACLRNGCVTLPGFPALMLQRRLWRRNRRAFDAIIAVSQSLRRRFEEDGIAVRDVIWGGTPDVPARPPLMEPHTVTFAGRLVPEKGGDVLLRAFARVHQRISGARLIVAGTGPDAPRLRGLLAELELTNAVAMPGHLGGMDLEAALNAAWVHAVPSLWPEPFGLTTTEAMMRGTAVVASRIGGMEESVVHGVTGLLVPPGDVDALAEALLTILGDRSLAERFGTAGRDRARAHFSIDRLIDRFEALYQELLSELSSG